MSFFFVNMAVADIIVAVFAMPESTIFYFRHKEWPGGVGGDILCRIVKFAFPVAIAASIFTLVAMTIGRFIAVMYPLKVNKFRAPKTFSVVIWASSTILMIPRILTFSVNSEERAGDCYPDWRLFGNSSQTFTTGETILNVAYFALLFLLPVVVMIIFFSLMCKRLHPREIPGELNSQEEARRKRDLQHRRVVKMLLTIVVVFIVCWIPVHAMHFMWLLNPIAVPYYVGFFLYWCGHTHSAINPWMYIYLNTQFRQAFLELIGRGKTGHDVQGRNRNDTVIKTRGPPRSQDTMLVVDYETVL